MGFFDNEENVNEYIKMTEDYEGGMLINILAKHLKAGSSILELGMGPGKDLDILSDLFKATGSDSSQVFIDNYRKRNSNTEAILLDAITMNTDDTYDCIYSNKVLQHLAKSELDESISNQWNTLNDNGLIFHSFWYGDGVENYDGLRFVYYGEDELKEKFSKLFNIVEIKRFKEEEDGDSIYIIGIKKKG